MALTKEDLQAISELLSPINARLDGMDKRFDNMDKQLAEIREEHEVIRSSQLLVELVEFPRIAAALEGASSALSKNKEQDADIDMLKSTAENHEIRIWGLEHSVARA